jgi:hypothetical protein
MRAGVSLIAPLCLGEARGVISAVKQFFRVLKHDRKPAVVEARSRPSKGDGMSITSVALIAALAAGSAPQEPRVETRTEVHVVTMGGPDGPDRLDADGDGFVTREEFSAPMTTVFSRLDADSDGRLSRDELASGHEEGHRGPHTFTLRREGGPGGHGGPGNLMMFHGGPEGGGDREVVIIRRGGPGVEGRDAGEWHGPGERRVEIRRFGGPDGHGDMDTNRDGRVSEEEFLAPLRDAFQRLDADSDGALEEGERPVGPPPPAG